MIFERRIRARLTWGGLCAVLMLVCCATSAQGQGYSESRTPLQSPSPSPSVAESSRPSSPVRSENSDLSKSPASPFERQNDQIHISSDFAEGWNEVGGKVYLLRGDCLLQQGDTKVRGQRMVVWRSDSAETGQEKIAVYLEGQVAYELEGRRFVDPQMFVRLRSSYPLRTNFRHHIKQTQGRDDEFYRRAAKHLVSPELPLGIEQTQYVVPEKMTSPSNLELVQFQPSDNSLRRVRIFPRSSQPFNASSRMSENTIPPEQITIINGGIQVLIDGVTIPNSSFQVGTIDLSADRVVIWTDSSGTDGFRQELLQTRDAQLQIYLEGNIVIRQGNRTIRASRAFYDARSERALILDAELKAYVPQLQSDIRIRAERIRQLSPDHLHAHNAWTSTSQYGKPGYRIQASDVYLENRPRSTWNGPPPLTIDPETGEAVQAESLWMTSLNNTFILEDYPLFYTPILSGPAENPNLPIRNVRVSQDGIFGAQLELTWDLEQIFGLQLPDNVEWDLRTDYYSERGPRLGTDFRYTDWGLFGPDPTSRGFATAEIIYDDDRDNLGRDRRSVPFPENERGLALWRHEQRFSTDMLLRAELGYISDRNYLEQYHERVFDRQKDVETLIYLQQNIDNWSWSLLARPELNDFEATTEWLPKADLYALSEPLFNSLLTYSSHSSVGYGVIEAGDPSPFPAQDVWNPLPYLGSTEGLVTMTRHQVDAPFAIGPVNFVPFVMGEAAYWEQDLTNSSLDRLVGQAGARAHLMMWKMYPYVQSELFNLRGLMHKVDFNAKYTFTDSSTGFGNIPQYNQFEENSQERFRRRFLTNTFGGALPLVPGYATSPYDPRNYILRSGAGSNVTSPYHEIIDDQQALRLNMRHRLQTKMGPPERTRVEDWMVLDTGAVYFPNSGADNFGENFGLLYADYEWRIGARNKLVADVGYDLFDIGQRTWSVGLHSKRSHRGTAFVGLRQITGFPIDSRILTTQYSYQMSPKWISTFRNAYDLGENENRGQNLTITRVGEYALLHFGASYNAPKDNFNFSISFEPKIGSNYATSQQINSLFD
ncbi:MAG: hypothetical protein HUJ26_06300 [Planctomycetaceae bacterium]|nr:hypothetical protein [Planctomycetaceae bacterium]